MVQTHLENPSATSPPPASLPPVDQRRAWSTRLAWLPLPVFLMAMAVLWIVDPRVAWPLPILNWLVHYGSAALGVVFIVIAAGRSFLANGQPSVLMLGCGVLMTEIGAAAMPAAFARTTGTGFAIYNTSVLLSALCHFTGVAITARREIRLRRRAAWLTGAFAGATAAMGLVTWLALTDRMPVFFIDGEGGTLLRSLVVSAAVALFLLTASLLWQTNRRVWSPFLQWYAPGLVLVAAGLAGSMAIIVRDSPLQWVTRSTQILGLVYMCLAVLTSARESSAKGIALASVEDAWRQGEFLASLQRQTPLGWALRYGVAGGAVAVAMLLKLALEAWVGPGLPAFITFYPVVMAVALVAGLGPGALATGLAGFVAAYYFLPPTGRFAITSPVDRLALVIFAGMGLGMSLVADLYRRHRDKAAVYDRETVMRESQARLATFAEATFEGIVESDAGRIVDCNEQLARMLGYSVAELQGMAIADLIIPEDRDRVIANIRQGRESAIEHAMLRKDGTRIVVEVHGRPVSPGSARRHTAIRDITERKLAEEALQRAKAALEQRVQERTGELSQAMGDLQAEVDLRTEAEHTLLRQANQLRALASELTLAEQRERRRVAEVLHDSVQQLLVAARLQLAELQQWPEAKVSRTALEVTGLIAQSLATSRTLTYELSPPMLYEGGLVPALKWLTHWTQDNHGLTVDLTATGAVAVEAEDTRILLFQAVRELLFNIVKHAQVQTASVQLECLGDQIRVVVGDDGVGFEPAQLSAEGGRAGGFGLLSIRERLTLLGGRMEIDRARGQGTRFTLWAPLRRAGMGSGPAPAGPERLDGANSETGTDATGGAARKIRVLLVDDHGVVRQGLTLLLAAEPDIEIVAEAADGKLAVELAGQLLPDVVLMDVSMPVMDGVEATRAIHSAYPAVQVIGLSTFEEDAQAHAMRDAGAVAYLSKSGPAEALPAAIRACQRHMPPPAMV